MDGDRIKSLSETTFYAVAMYYGSIRVKNTRHTLPAALAEKAAPVRVGALKGPTAMGMVQMMADKADAYDFTLATAPDEIVPLLVKGELDIAAVPANLGSVLYNNTQGAVKALAINTLGVLYIVERGDTVHSVADLKGRTLVTAGKGSTPEYALNYILRGNGLRKRMSRLPDDAKGRIEPPHLGNGHVRLSDVDAVGLRLGGRGRVVVDDEARLAASRDFPQLARNRHDVFAGGVLHPQLQHPHARLHRRLAAAHVSDHGIRHHQIHSKVFHLVISFTISLTAFPHPLHFYSANLPAAKFPHTRRACATSMTSCTRTTLAPFAAAQMATATSPPRSESVPGSPARARTMRLRLAPTSTRPFSASAETDASSARSSSRVVPKPTIGSR